MSGVLKPLQRGFTLVELLIAMSLSIFLIAVAGQVLVSGFKTYGAVNKVAKVQETGRFALQLLTDDIKKAGYFGSNAEMDNLSGEETSTFTCAADAIWGKMITQPLFGIDSNNTGYATCIGTNLSDTDVMAVRYAKPWLITTTISTRFYIRSSLIQSKIFTGTNQATNIVAEPNTLHELAAHAYYIKNSGRTCSGAAIPSLFRVALNDSGVPVEEELLPGIEDIQFQYGMTGGRYLNAGNTGLTTQAHWDNVNRIKVTVMARSECPERDYNDGKSYSYANKTNYLPADNFRRQLYTSVVTLRN